MLTPFPRLFLLSDLLLQPATKFRGAVHMILTWQSTTSSQGHSANVYQNFSKLLFQKTLKLYPKYLS